MLLSPTKTKFLSVKSAQSASTFSHPSPIRHLSPIHHPSPQTRHPFLPHSIILSFNHSSIFPFFHPLHSNNKQIKLATNARIKNEYFGIQENSCIRGLFFNLLKTNHCFTKKSQCCSVPPKPISYPSNPRNPRLFSHTHHPTSVTRHPSSHIRPFVAFI